MAKPATSEIPIIFATKRSRYPRLCCEHATTGRQHHRIYVRSAELLVSDSNSSRDFPGRPRLAILADVENLSRRSPVTQVQAAARTLGLNVAKLEIRRQRISHPLPQALRPRSGAQMSLPRQLAIERRQPKLSRWR